MLMLIMTVLTGCASTSPQPQEKTPQIVEAAKINMKLGIAYLQKGEVQRAKEKLMLAQSQAPRYPAVWYAMAYYQEVTGELQEAERMYKRAISIAPRDGSARNNYGTFLCRHKRYTDSILQFQKAVKDPKYLDVAEAYENMGLCAKLIPDQAKAREFFERALKQNGQLPTTLIEMTKLEIQSGHLRKADIYLQRYSALLPDTAESLWLQARLAHRMGKKERAAQYWRKLKKRFPKSGYAKRRYRF